MGLTVNTSMVSNLLFKCETVWTLLRCFVTGHLSSISTIFNSHFTKSEQCRLGWVLWVSRWIIQQFKICYLLILNNKTCISVVPPLLFYFAGMQYDLTYLYISLLYEWTHYANTANPEHYWKYLSIQIFHQIIFCSW